MPQYIPFPAGSRVKCNYRVNDTTKHEHVGTVLAKDDPRAWAGTLAFPESDPDPAAVKAHVEKCERRREDVCGVPGPSAQQPVKWDFGRIYWDSQLYAAE
jgi:hypothetical protein